MFSSLTCPASQRLLDVVQTGALGGLRSLHLDTCFAKGHPGTAELGRPRRETEPTCYEVQDAKRELTNVGVYPLTVLASVLPDRVWRVVAATGNYFFREHQQRNMEDFGQILLQTESGLLATCTAGRTGWQSHPGMGLNRVAAIGSRTIYTADGDDPHLVVWSDGSPWLPPPRNPDDPMGMWLLPADSPFQPAPKQDRIGQAALSPSADVAYFLDCLQNGRPSIADHTVAATASRVLLAAYRSAATGMPVEL